MAQEMLSAPESESVAASDGLAEGLPKDRAPEKPDAQAELSPRRGQRAPAWRSGPPRRSGGFRKTRIGAAWLGTLALLGMFIWASSWLHPPRSCSLVLLGAGYQENLAIDENVYGWQSLSDLAEVVREGDFAFWGKNLLQLRQEPQQWRTDTNWKQLLSTTESHTLVAVLAVHGGTDGNGAYLLPHNASADDTPENRIRLADVLDVLASLPADKNKVLILDATTVASNWQLGMLHNDFARQLERLAPRIESIAGLVVLASSDIDQRSWTCPELRRTIYFHYIIEGLRGAARDTENDGRINAWELHQYVSRNVQRWSQANRGILQTPILLPKGDQGRVRAAQVDLAVAVNHYRPTDLKTAPPREDSPELQAWWQSHAVLANQVPAPTAYAPQLWRQYQQVLLRCEQLVLAGDMNAAASLARELRALEVALERARLLDLNSRQNSLDMAAACGVLPPLTSAAQEAVSQLWNCPEGEVAKRWNAIQQAAAKQGTSSGLPRQVATLLYDRAAADPATNLAKASQLLLAVEDPLFPRPAEVHFLRMMNLGLVQASASAASPAANATFSGAAAQGSQFKELREAASAIAAGTGNDTISNSPAPNNSVPNSPSQGSSAQNGPAQRGNAAAGDASAEARPTAGPTLNGANGINGAAGGGSTNRFASTIRSNAELLTLALNVRRLAAKTVLDAEPGAASYSNLTFTWIASQVDAADRLRRAGEDLLFAGPNQQQQALRFLQQAETAYQQAWNDVTRVREALDARNQALSVLPYYARWVASRAMLDDGSDPPDDSLLVGMQNLLIQSHELDRQLHRQPATDATLLREQLQRLTEQTQAVQRGLDRVLSQSQSWWWELTAVELPSVWHEAYNALQIPQVDPGLRSKIRSVWCKTSRRLYAESAQAMLSGRRNNPAAALPTVSRQWQQYAAQTYGRRQGVMALAVLGQEWFDWLLAAGNSRGPSAAGADASAGPSASDDASLPAMPALNASGLAASCDPAPSSMDTPTEPPLVRAANRAVSAAATSKPTTGTSKVVAAPLPNGSAAKAEMPSRGSASSTRLAGGRSLPSVSGAPTGSADATNRPNINTVETFEEVQHRLRVFSVEENWWDSLTVAGEQLGRRWRRIGPAIEALTAQSQHVVPWADRRPLLAQSNRLCRLIAAAPAAMLTTDPAGLYRRLTTAQLLLWQAQRCWMDHWYAEDSKAVPYYRVAGNIYLDDAGRLTRPDPELDRWRKKLSQPGNLVLQGVARLDLTTEVQRELDFVVQPAPGADVPPGMPVLWITTGQGLASAVPADGFRQARALDESSRQGHFRCVITSPALEAAAKNPPPQPKVETSSVTAYAWFRGQQFSASSAVYLHLRPEVTRIEPRKPSTASVAVRATPGVQQRFGTGTGAVAIVLDASGSMGPPAGSGNSNGSAGVPTPASPGGATGGAGAPANGTFKYAEATQVLRQVLSELPSGTVVSIWVFGQAMGSQKTVDDANRTVRRIQDPLVWNAEDPKQLDQVMAAVSYPNLEPWNESPIVRAMMMAKQDLDGAAGFKTLVVLTDGQDNCFAKDKQYNPNGQDIPTALRNTFASSGIAVNIVGFKMEPKEKSAALQQFASVETWSPPGKFVLAEDAASLANLLRAAMRQRMRYWVDTFGGGFAPGMPPQGLDVTMNEANLQWYPGGLQPGSYMVHTQTDQPLQAAIGVNRGDLLLLQLTRGASGVQFQRPVYSKTDFPWKPFQQAGSWRMAVLQNQQMPASGLQMLLTLEREPYAAASMLQQVGPREIWLEVQPADKSAAPIALEWGYQYGYPAPAWTVNVPVWPQQNSTARLVSPRVSVWWNPDQTLIPGAVLDRGHDFRLLSDLAGQTIQVGQSEATIEGVAVEEHLVSDGQGNQTMQNCLVVRISHRPDHPVMVGIEGLDTAASEARLYRSIGKATFFYWPVTRDQAAEALQRLLLYSINDLKAKAEQRGYSLRMNRLPPPAASDTRPLPYELQE